MALPYLCKLESEFHKNLTEFHQFSPKNLQNLTDFCQQLMARMRGNVFISSVSSLSTLFLFHPCSSLSSLLLSLPSKFLFFSGRWHKMTHKGWHVIKPQHNQSINYLLLFFWENIVLTFCVNHLPSKWFTWNAKTYFFWKINNNKKFKMLSATDICLAL